MVTKSVKQNFASGNSSHYPGNPLFPRVFGIIFLSGYTKGTFRVHAKPMRKPANVQQLPHVLSDIDENKFPKLSLHFRDRDVR